MSAPMRLGRLCLLTLAAALAATQAPAVPLRPGLPLVEVADGTHGGDTLAVFYSGDGGWAKVDRGVAGRLAQAGVPVVGYDSLLYFWTARTPVSAAADLASVLQHYMAAWG